VPAAAVIPAPVAYIKVVAVKKLVVGFLVGHSGPRPSGSVLPEATYHLTRVLSLPFIWLGLCALVHLL
jgi:hypothetical protein